MDFKLNIAMCQANAKASQSIIVNGLLEMLEGELHNGEQSNNNKFRFLKILK